MPRLLIVFAFVITATPHGTLAAAEGITAQQIIDRHIEARGGAERLRALKNLRYSGGNYSEPGFETGGTAMMTLGRPFLKLVGNPDEPGDFMEGYDGSAWEWYANPGVVLRTVGKASEAIRHYAGVEGPLLDYAEKGSSVRFLGRQQVQDLQTYAVELTRRDGFVEIFYFAIDSFLIVALSQTSPIHAFGDGVNRWTRVGDYREVSGIQIPFRFVTVQMPGGQELSSMQWGQVEADVELPDDWFSPPAFERTPIQKLIEDLFGQRDDLGAMTWTLDEFQRAYPTLDTADALNTLGFQILKMGQVKHAIAMLQRNVREHPDQADTHFGLGRALDRAGRVLEARMALKRALAIDPDFKRAADFLQDLSD